MAGVIRRERVIPSRVFSFADVEQRANQLLAAARTRADEIIAAAEQQAQMMAEQLRKEACAAGLAEGRRAGAEQAYAEARSAAVEKARGELARLTDALRAGLAEYERQRHSLRAAAESGLIELAIAIARRVCKTVVTASTESALANCRALLGLVQHAADVEVRFSPAECELLAAVVPGLARDIAGLEHVRMSGDPAVAAGGCLIRTRDGELDANIDTQLDRIAAAIGNGAATGAGE